MSIVNHELYHHGVKGMKWGVRRKKEFGSSFRDRLKNARDKFNARRERNLSRSRNPNSIKNLTNDELRKLNERLRLVKENYELKNSIKQLSQTKKGESIVKKMFKKSAENIGTQATTYAMGKAINTLFGGEIVNPKKGQKDK